MPTANRRPFIPSAIRLFFAQDYPNKELLIIDDGAESIADLIPSDPRVRCLRHEPALSVGSKRNLACKAARGEIILHWDDDDWYAPWRLAYQVEKLDWGGFDVCGLDRAFFVDARLEQAWEYVYRNTSLPWLCGATLCYRKSFWENHRFADVSLGEDTHFVFGARDARIAALEDNRFFVARIHAANSSPKRPRGGLWETRPIDAVRSIVGSEWEAYFGGQGGLPMPASCKVGTALISAASGIGDILRVTPLVRAADQLGYDVDVLVSPDDPDAAELLRGAPQIRRLITYPDVLTNRAAHRIAELEGQQYDLATFTYWSAPLSKYVAAQHRYTFDPSWRCDGDIASVENIARAIGWQGELPAPFAMKSARRFDLLPATVAFHPGCKPNWPWKKWHGFDELAEFFSSVVVVGTPADLDNSRTYFGRPFRWPEHVRDFTGKLELRDTAALISQCAALVSLDSGLMHLGVALRVPTFGIFGITNPERECIPSPFMTPISKQLSCEPACRRDAWGRRDCEHHLQCLKTLTAEEVATRAAAALPAGAIRCKRVVPNSNETITLNYYGEVFASSGYGQAARAYVHAFDAAGIRVHVIDTGARLHQVEDERIASLLGHDPHADFNLFHGIPSFWARAAYRVRNVIAMTVWEADQMPQIWRNPLSHAIDVWLPSAFTIDVFTRDLGRAPYRLPHALFPRPNGAMPAYTHSQFGVEPADFVFYSIFEWQDRKNPHGLIEAFLKAFPDESDVVLLIKTSARFANEAQEVAEQLRVETQSPARVILWCESFDETRMQALHARGDCYVSLHRGEGWGYPLFEAAASGKPIVATAYGGPLDYLDTKRHWLVRYTLLPVSRPYFLYRPSMNWAEPDLDHAREGLRWVYEHRVEARAAAEEAAHELRTSFSLERIGEAAKARLIELKKARPQPKDAEDSEPQPLRTPVVLPIPGDWFDADYFEHGRKSNWSGGYAWSSFQGLFRETAALLHETFPEATSFVDVGCAKGFLVQALRERGLDARGFDHSEWAITNAQASVKPFLELASLDSMAYDDRSIDVVVAMSLFESLTEEQISQILLRARRWVRRALFATIPIQTAAVDRDLSHITMHEPQWWCDRFAEAGWRQDPTQSTVERHPLPKRMKWGLYIFEPAS